MNKERTTFSENLTSAQRWTIVGVYWAFAFALIVTYGPWSGTWISYNLLFDRSHYFEAYTCIEAWLAAGGMWPIATGTTLLAFAVLYIIFKGVWRVVKEKKKTPIRDRIPERQKSAEHGDSWPMEKWEKRANGIMWFYPQRGYTMMKSRFSNIPKKHKEYNAHGVACPPRFGMVIEHEGEAGAKDECYTLSPEGHTMTFAKTGGKKTREHVVQTMHLKAGLRLESMVIPDEKEELFKTCAEALRATHTVRQINLSNPAMSDSYNILDEINYLVDCGEVGKAESLAAELGMTIATASDDKEVSTWKEAAAGLINAMILFVSMRGGENERCASNVFKLLRRYSPERTMMVAQGKRVLEKRVGLLDAIFEELGEQNPNDPAYLAYGTADIAKGRTASSIGFSTSNALQVFANSQLQEMGTNSSFKLEDIGNEPFVLFISIPHETKAFKVFYSIIISQVYQALVRSAKENGGKLKNTVTFMLEEWGVTPIIDELPQKINIGRALDIWFSMIAQEKDMVHRYDKGRSSAESVILGACNTIVYKSSNCPKTHQYISGRLQKYTILKEAESDSSKKMSISPFDGHISKNQSKAPRPYHTVDEVAAIDPSVDGSLVFFGGGFGWFYTEDMSKCSSNDFFGMPAPSGCLDTDITATQELFKERAANRSPVGQRMPNDFNAVPFIPKALHGALRESERASYYKGEEVSPKPSNQEAYQQGFVTFNVALNEAACAGGKKGVAPVARNAKLTAAHSEKATIKAEVRDDEGGTCLETVLNEKTPLAEVIAAIERAEAEVERMRRGGELPPGARAQVIVAKMLGKSQGWVGQRKKLAKLIPALQEALDAGDIRLSQALELAKLSDADQVMYAVKLDYAINPAVAVEAAVEHEEVQEALWV